MKMRTKKAWNRNLLAKKLMILLRLVVRSHQLRPTASPNPVLPSPLLKRRNQQPFLKHQLLEAGDCWGFVIEATKFEGLERLHFSKANV